MPRVPRYDSPTVAPDALPTPQLSGASPAAFGAELGQGLQQSAAGLNQLAQQQEDDMDAARITAVIPMLDDAEHQVVTTARSKQGWDTLPVHDQAVEQFDTATSQIVNGMANDRQKRIVRTMAARQRGSISTELDNYTNSEIRRAQQVDLQSAVASTANLAVSHYQDADRLAQDFAKGEALIRSYGKRAGVSAETTDQQVAAWASGVHVGVVERALQNQQVEFAKQYLADNKAAIDGDQVGRLEHAVAESGTLAEAFAQTDRIMAATTDLGEAQKMVREIKDPEVRQRTQSEVDQRFQEQEAAHRIAENHLFEGWSAQLERVRDINTLRAQMGADWFKLDQNSRQSLEERARQLQQLSMGVPIKTNERVWTEFTLASPERQAQVNPLKDLLPYLSESDYQQAVQYIAQLRQGGRGAVEGVTSAKEQLLTSAAGAGIVPRDPVAKWDEVQVQRYSNMQRAMNLQLQAFKDKNNRNPTPVESQEIVDGLMVQQLRLQKPIIFNWPVLGTRSVPVPASSVIDADVADMTKEDLDAVQVPQEFTDQMTNLMRSNNRRASRVDIVRLWLAALRNDPTVGQELLPK